MTLNIAVIPGSDAERERENRHAGEGRSLAEQTK